MSKTKFKVGEKVRIWYHEDWSRKDLQGKEGTVILAPKNNWSTVYILDIPGVTSGHHIHEDNLYKAENGIERARRALRSK